MRSECVGAEPNAKVCVVFGSAPLCGVPSRQTLDGALIIAADGGLAHLQAMGVTPHIVCGDFDSLGYVPHGDNVVVLPREKDVTDLCACVDKGIGRECAEFWLYGAYGGRFGHTMANLQCLARLSRLGLRGYLCTDTGFVTAVTNGGLTLSARESGYFSVFAYGGTARGVSVRGGVYCLEGAILRDDNPLGVSNEFMGEAVVIEVKDGTVMVADS